MSKTERTYAFGKSTVTVKLGNIVDSTADVLVSSDDTKLSMSGGVSLALLRAGGPTIQKDAEKQSRDLSPGNVIVTTAGDLKAVHIFHAITRRYGSAPTTDPALIGTIVESLVRECLNKLRGMNLKSIAMPALGTGFAGFSPVEVAANLTRALRRQLQSVDDCFSITIHLLPQNIQNDMGFWRFVQELDQAASVADSVVEDHAVALVHGILTEATWFERVGAMMKAKDPQLHPRNCGYGTFDLVRFLLPGQFTKEAVIKKVEGDLMTLASNPRYKHVSVVAHSFGTKIVCEILRRNRDNGSLKLHRVILCGSVLDQHYRWHDHVSQLSPIDDGENHDRYVINDCGWRDPWPVIAKFVTWGYGMSGRTGFQSPPVVDRFHSAGHSDFFSDQFVAEFWIPFLANGEVKASPIGRPSGRLYVMLLNAFKLPHLLMAAFVAVALYRTL